MSQRLHYRRRLSYNTRSNKVKVVKTPGGKLTYIYTTKRSAVPKCGDCHKDLQGIPAVRPIRYSQLSKRQKHVTRAYGGSRCHGCVRDRILRAFLLEEQKIVKKVLKSKASSDAPAAETPIVAAEKKAAAAKIATKGVAKKTAPKAK